MYDLVIRNLWMGCCLVLLLAACNTDDDGGPARSDGLVYSPSPIDLQGIEAAFAADVAYGSHPSQRFDIFLPAATAPTGLTVFIHGGGFKAGEKEFIYETDDRDFPEQVRTLLSQNVAVATLDYRLLDPVGESRGVLKCLTDCRRAVQYLRFRASDFNIRPDDIVLYGTSAGAGSALWLSVSPDMRNPASADLVERESTRVKGVVLVQTQSSYDIENRWMNDVFVDYGLSWPQFAADYASEMLQFYGVSDFDEYDSPSIAAYRQEVDMLGLMSADDPEIWANNTETPVEPPVTQYIAYHHAYHVREIKEYADAAGIPNVCYYGRDPIIYADPSGESQIDFILRKLNE